MTSFFQQLASQLQVATLYMQGCGKLHVTYSYRKLENQLTSYTCQFFLPKCREIAKERIWPLKWAIPEKIQTGGVEDMLF